VIGPVTVAVHLNVNPTLIVIRPVAPLRCPLVDGSDHLHGVVPVHVHVHGHDHGVDHDHGHDRERAPDSIKTKRRVRCIRFGLRGRRHLQEGARGDAQLVMNGQTSTYVDVEDQQDRAITDEDS